MHGIIEKVVSDSKFDCVYVNSDGEITQFAFPADTIIDDCVGKFVELIKVEDQDWVIDFVEE